jgi:sugar phosphate permease
MTLFSKRKKPAEAVVATTNSPVAGQDGERSHAEIMVVVVALMLAMLLAALDQTIVSTALPRIAVDLNGLNKLSWVVTAYLIASAVVTPLYGKISDQLGRKKIFQAAIIIFLIGSALCGLAQSMDQLIIFRALQGLGAGGLMALVFAIIGDIIPPRQRGRYQGRCVGACQYRRAAARRRVHRPLDVALDFLHQPAARFDCAFGNLCPAASAGA